jgi:hypothetical protein
MLSIKHVTVRVIVLLLHVWMLDLLCPSIVEVVAENSEKLYEDP